MKSHRILKSFPGSNDGLNTKHFTAGTVEPLSDGLAAIVVKAGWAEPVVPSEPEEHQASPAENRETKVDAPEEFKEPAEASRKKKRA
jgi:hypothetical protein